MLADDGTLWLNLGDSYAGGPSMTGTKSMRQRLNASHLRNDTIQRGSAGVPAKNLLGIPWRVAFALQDDDSGDIYELRADAPESVRSAIYLETCRIKTPKHGSGTTASTQSVGAKPIPSDTPSDDPHGMPPTPTNSGATAESITNSTASKRLSGKSRETSGDTVDSDSLHCNTTAASNQSVPAVENGGSHSSPSTTSTAVATSTVNNSAPSTSTSGSTYGGSPTPPDSESSATTATVRLATTASARTKPSGLRIRKRDIPPSDLQHFSLVKQERWILRNAVIWQKPNAMPESVTDRLSGRYEHVFLFSKSRRYWFDLDPIREPHTTLDGDSGWAKQLRNGEQFAKAKSDPNGNNTTSKVGQGARIMGFDQRGRNPGDVWPIPTSPFPGAHFAVFPVALPQRCILAGCKPGGTVLDPFNGSGTTGLAAQKTGRKYIGIDINREYLDLTLRTRLQNAALDFGEVS